MHRDDIPSHLMIDGLAAATLSALALAWRGRIDDGSAAAPMNAVTHWIWPRRALRRDDTTWQHTGLGAAIHYASSLLWTAVYGAVRQRRRDPNEINALTDAAAVAAAAAVVDLAVVPKRLSPGFEERLTPRSLVWVYAGVAAGLAVGGLMALRR